MKKIILSIICLLLSMFAFTQSDTIYTNKERIIGNVKEITEEVVKFTYPNEDLLNSIYNNTVRYIVFKNGRVQVFSASSILRPQNEVHDTKPILVNDIRDKCLIGRSDAENFHGKKGGHFALGVIFGPFAMIGTALSEPTPERGKHTYIASENKDLFSDPVYRECYKKQVKGELIAMEGIGFLSWLLFSLLFISI